MWSAAGVGFSRRRCGGEPVAKPQIKSCGRDLVAGIFRKWADDLFHVHVSCF